jgi:predicted transport protein
MVLTDRFLDLIREIEPAVTLKYNKNYIGLARSGIASNFVTFRPKKKWVNFEAKIAKSDDLNERLAHAGIEQLAYGRWGYYRMGIAETDFDEHADLLGELVALARATYDG